MDVFLKTLKMLFSAVLKVLTLTIRFLARLLKSMVLFLIKFYQKFLSPLFPPVCRFKPTCSVYAVQAIEKYGVFKGGFLALWRIIRCNPFSKGGYDPP